MADEVIPDSPLSEINEELDLGDVSTGDLQALIDEHIQQKLGPLWLREIETAVPRVARRYPPAVYARSFEWDDDAIRDLVQDVVERMLVKGQAEYICDTANDFGHARALIYRQVKMTLIDRRQRTAVDNLFDRAVECLSAPPFKQAGRSPVPGVSVARRPSPHRTRGGSPRRSRRCRVPGHGAERASAIWTTETLTDALNVVCAAVGEVTELDLRKILDESLTVFATAEVVTDDAGTEDRSGELDPSDRIMANDITERLITTLTREEATLLAGKWIGDSDGDIARRLGVSRPTAAKHKESAYSKVRDELTSQNEAVVGYVFGRLQTLVIAKAGGGAP